MHVGRIGRQLPAVLWRYGGEIGVFTAGGHVDVAVATGFLDRLLGPLPGIDVIRRFALAQQIHGHHGELRGGTALQEQHGVVVADPHQAAQVLLGLFGNFHEHLVPMAHFHDGQAHALVIQHFLTGLLQNIRRQRRRTCAEVIGAGHAFSP